VKRLKIKRLPNYFFVMFTSMLSACVNSPVQVSNDHIANGDYNKAVIEYRKASIDHPNNVEYRSRLEQIELRAAEHYYQLGLLAMETQDFPAAIEHYEQGLVAIPKHPKLIQALNQAVALKEAHFLEREAINLFQAGKTQEAYTQVKKALELVPTLKSAQGLAKEIESHLSDQSQQVLGPFQNSKPITLDFRGTDIRTAFQFIGKSNNVNIIFDENIKSGSLTLSAKNVSFEQALSLMMKTTQTFYKTISEKTLIIIPETLEKRRQYEDYIIRTFFLTAIRAKTMLEIIKGLLKVNSVIINEAMNTIIVRDTEHTISLIAKLIEANDRKPAEMILEVEILEVNRSKAERLGLDFGGYQLAASIPSSEIITLNDNIPNAYGSLATLTLPALTFRFYKQDVDAKILANPKIRVINAKQAKIHIGDRVPLRASTITDATGQVRTTYDYKEIGIRLLTEPFINLDNSVEVKLSLEVSTLGENIGTVEESAFRIGTRNAETFMLLRDGETAILGGLIRDEDRNTRVRIPGLGDIPIFGTLFSNFDRSGGRTDILLTITPRVVRGWDIPSPAAREFFSGSAETYMTRSLYAENLSKKNRLRKSIQPPQTTIAKRPSPDVRKQQKPLFLFDEAVYEAKVGDSLLVNMQAELTMPASALTWTVVYDPNILQYDAAPSNVANDLPLSHNADQPGQVKFQIRQSASSQTGILIKDQQLGQLRFKAKQRGIAYLIYRATEMTDLQGQKRDAQVKAARIIVR